MAQSKIEWTDVVDNIIVVESGGWWCRRISPGCDNCLAPETPILHADMKWRPIGETRVGDVLLGFDEHPEPGRTRKIRPSIVEAVWWSRKETRRLITSESDIITTGNHRWLRGSFTGGCKNWPTTDRLRVGKPLRQIGEWRLSMLNR